MKTPSQPDLYDDLACKMNTLRELDRLSHQGQRCLRLNDDDRALLVKYLVRRIDELQQLMGADPAK